MGRAPLPEPQKKAGTFVNGTPQKEGPSLGLIFAELPLFTGLHKYDLVLSCALSLLLFAELHTHIQDFISLA